MTHFFLLLIWSLAGRLAGASLCDEHDNVNLSALDDSVWNYLETAAIRSDTDPGKPVNVTTQTFFRFCRPLGDDAEAGCAGANVCVVRRFHNGTRLVERYTAHKLVPSSHSMQLSFVSNDTCGLGLEKRIHVDFSCDHDRGLGRPYKLLTQPCITTFNWPSIAACTSFQKHPILSKCYIYDDDGHLRDLTHLIAKDGHTVESESEVDGAQYILNICSEVNNSCHTPKSSSSSGTSVCVRRNPTVEHLGDVRKSSLSYDGTSDEVVVRYSSSASSPTCPSGAFVTLIRLRCPPTRSQPSFYGLESRKPFLLQKTDCQLVVEWQTDYACPVHVYKAQIGHQSCGIHVDDSFLDLKPLSRNYSYLIQNVTSGNETLDIALNVCDGLAFPEASLKPQFCKQSDWASDAVCVRSSSRGSILVASMVEAELIYADGIAQLSYPVRQNFSCTGTSKAIITFPCDHEAGDGEPTFTSFTDCVLSIEWRTSRACLPSHQRTPSCSARSDWGLLYDLTPLRRKPVQVMWKVSLVDFKGALFPGHKHDANSSMQLNVCGELPSHVVSDSPRSSVAYLYGGHENKTLSLGRFNSAPFVEHGTQKLILVYNGTQDLGSGKRNVVTSSIIFTCTPGIVESIPKLTNVSIQEVSPNETRTSYTLEWGTGAACGLTRVSGTDCVVVDNNLGLKLDLNPLHEEHHDIEKRVGSTKYLMNFCGPVKSGACRGENVGICRQDANGTAVSLGQFSRNVTYWNGLLTLHYEHGSIGPSNASQSSEIVFVCDEGDSRELELISESGDVHTFRMYTKHACPDMHNVVPCVWQNDTHSVDLSPLARNFDNEFTGLLDPDAKTSTMFYYSFCRPLVRLNHEESNCREGSAACRVVMKDGKVESTLSLGIPRDPPAVYFGHEYLSLIYTNGDKCPSNDSARMSFVIKFHCSEDEGDGIDHQINTISNGCAYEVEFHTNLVCAAFPSTEKPAPAPLPSAGSYRRPLSTFAVVIVLLLVLIALAMAFLTLVAKGDNGSRIVSRLRSLVCRDLIPSDPIHYSQLQSGGSLAFVSATSSSPSPYNSTTTTLNEAPLNALITRLSRSRSSRDSSEDTAQLI